MVRRFAVPMMLILLPIVLIGCAQLAALVPNSGCQELVLDGVEVDVCAPFIPKAPFVASAPSDALQVATAAALGDPYREFSVEAIPFGTRLGEWPIAEAGSGAVYRALLEEFRREQGGSPVAGPVAGLFGQQAQGLVSVLPLDVGGDAPLTAEVAEWVIEAGERVWLVRYSREVSATKAITDELEGLADIELSSADLARPSTSLASLLAPPPAVAKSEIAGPDDLPVPPWWNGECDDVNYYAKSVPQVHAYPLGGAYRGVIACGPRYSPDVLVQFFPGAWGQYEWECPELTKRFMYLAYEIPPYSANGNTVVANCTTANKCWLEKVYNGTVGRAPMPGDVLSYGPASLYGHTSLVAQSDVDAGGDGSIVIIEQNNSASGQQTLTVSDWWVYSSMTVIGWLHNAGNFTVDVAPQDLTMSGPVTASLGGPVTFSASIGRVATRQPVTYIWQATGQEPVTHTAGLTDVLTVAWPATGVETVTVTAQNAVGSVVAAQAIMVYDPAHSVQLPLTLTDYPEAGAPLPGDEVLINGSFEEVGVAWDLPNTDYPADYSMDQARSGSQSMRVGIVDPADNVYSYSSARQLVTIPADALTVTLTAWLYPVSGQVDATKGLTDTASLDPEYEEALILATEAQYIYILDASGKALGVLLFDLSDSRTWTLHQYDLNAYRGQTIMVHFGVHNDGVEGVTALYVDDASLRICLP